MHNTTRFPWDNGDYFMMMVGNGLFSELIIDSGGYAWEGFDGNIYYPNTIEDINNTLEEFMGIFISLWKIYLFIMHMKFNEETTVAEYPEGVGTNWG